MQYTVSLSRDGLNFFTKEVSADRAINIIAQVALEENIEMIKRIPLADEPTEEELDKSIENITGGGPAKKKYKTRKVKEAKFVPGKKRSGKKTVIDSQIYQVLDLKKEGKTIKEMAEEAGLSVSTVYRITSGALKPEGKRVVNTETPTKVGEREIDKKAPMLTPKQYDEVKEAHEEGMASDFMSLTMGYDIEQIRKAIKSDSWTIYEASY